VKPTKRVLALSLALVLLFALSACEWITKTVDDDVITTAAPAQETTAAPMENGAPAPMEPLQGGPMLYTFYGSEPWKMAISEESGDEYPVYPIGLIDRYGKPVSPAVYHNVEYIRDEAGERVIGLAAVKGREFTIYELDGKSRVLPVEGFNLEVCPGGRYALVDAADEGIFGGWDWENTLNVGLYDLKNDRWVMEPKEGQLLNYSRGGLVFGYQHDTANATGNETAQWAISLADESVTDLPLELGRIQDYYPETGWYGGIWSEKRGNDWTTGAYEARVYDRDLKVIPTLSGWSVDYKGFCGGQWCMVYNNNAFPDTTAWVNRAGELSGRRLAGWIGMDLGGPSYLIEDGRRVTLLDADLNEVVTAKAGEQLAALWPLGDSVRGDGYLLVDGKTGLVNAAYGRDAAPLQLPAEFRCWHNDGTDAVYSTQNGQLRALGLKQFFQKPQAGHRGGQPYARAIAACEDFVVVQTGVYYNPDEAGGSYDTFAVDWQGNRLEDCPLAPFFDAIGYRNAGEQGPYYHWVELDGQRGYINTQGEWLFIDES